MLTHKVMLDVFECRTDIYGAYNRYIFGYCDEFGSIEGLMKEKDCGVPLGFQGKVQATVAEFFSGRVLIERI